MDQFSKNVLNTWGQDGKQWLASLPHLVAHLKNKWQLFNLKPFSALSYNYVLHGIKRPEEIPVVLKIGFSNTAIMQEMSALRFYQGKGAVNLFEYDPDSNALLLEQVTPGNTLKKSCAFGSEAAIQNTAFVIKNLHSHPLSGTESFPKIEEWLLTLQKENKKIEKPLLDKANAISQDLLKSKANPVLLHGDLHDENLLQSDREPWLAIDPKGVIGEPAYEVGAFIRNLAPGMFIQSNPPQFVARHLHIFSELLSLNVQRLKAWSYVQAVLSAYWATEDNHLEFVDRFMKAASIIDAVKL